LDLSFNPRNTTNFTVSASIQGTYLTNGILLKIDFLRPPEKEDAVVVE